MATTNMGTKTPPGRKCHIRVRVHKVNNEKWKKKPVKVRKILKSQRGNKLTMSNDFPTSVS